MDAIDTVIAQFDGDGFPKIISDFSAPISSDLKKHLFSFATKQAINLDLFVTAHFALAKDYALAVHHALKKVKLRAKDIRAIGLHGQTVRHLPHP